MSPYQALYGREPPSLIATSPPASCPANVAQLIRQRGELLVRLRENLVRAQERMRRSTNKGRRDLEFAIGDRVWLKLQQYRQYSVARPLSSKLACRFYGPFEVIERIGAVAYRLRLPEGSRVHDVFHVSLLRPFMDGGVQVTLSFLTFFARGCVVTKPMKLIDKRTVLCHGESVEEGCLAWDDDAGKVPTWEPMDVIVRRFPHLLLEDKDDVNGGGVDTIGNAQRDRAPPSRQGAPEQDQFDARDGSEAEQRNEERNARPMREKKRPNRFNDFIAI